MLSTIQQWGTKLRQSTFFIRLFHWEYWPAAIANIPVIFMWLYFAIKARHLVFFSTVNPNIPTGGLFGESKMAIFRQMPVSLYPNTLFIPPQTHAATVLQQLEEAQLAFPVIAKPDVGERGLWVEKIKTPFELKEYQQTKAVNIPFLIQEYISYPIELSVLYYRFPDEQKGHISSVCQKEFLHIIGDGESTIAQLIDANPRAKLKLSRLQIEYADRWKEVLAKGTKLELVAIGNHARGTKFLNANDLIDEQLVNVFDEIGVHLPNIHLARFDLRCQSIENLKEGKSFKILELNGVGGEPAHIYDPSYSPIQAYKDLFQHWTIIYQISQMQKAKGVPPMSHWEAIKGLWKHLRYKQNGG